MLIEVGILACLHCGFRYLEKRKKRQHKKREEKSAPHHKPPTPGISPQAEIQARNQDYLDMSILSTLVSGANQYFFPSLRPLTLGLYSYISYPRTKSAAHLLFKEKKMGNDVLISIALLLGVLAGQYFPLSLSMCLYRIGDKIQEKTRDHSRRKLFDLFENQPRSAWLLKHEVEVEFPLSEIQAGDVIAIYSNETIPIDGEVIEGTAMVDQCILTGESRPVEKLSGEKVYASTLVLTGKLFVRVEKTGKETTISHIGNALNNVVDFKFRIQSKGEKWADQASGPILTTGALALPLLGPIGATTVLRSSFGQSLRVISSLHVLNHLRFAYNHSILVKDGRAIEYLDDIDVLLFDKTGTLTQERLEVDQIVSCSEYGENDILLLAAIAECKQSHPIAKAILIKTNESDISLPDIGDSEYFMGFGVKVYFNDKIIRVGSARFMEMEKIPISNELLVIMENSYAEGKSFSMIALDTRLVGAIDFQSVIRPEAESIISNIRQYGIEEIGIISGDHQYPTQKLAHSLHVDSYFYEITPEQKADIVEDYQNRNKTVCFVGDGINDAIAMKKADVAVSLNGASTVATDIAQVVFMDGSLNQLIQLFEISKELNTKLKKSLGITVTPAALTLSGAFLWNMDILSAVITDNAFFLTGLLGTTRTSRFGHPDRRDSHTENQNKGI